MKNNTTDQKNRVEMFLFQRVDKENKITNQQFGIRVYTLNTDIVFVKRIICCSICLSVFEVYRYRLKVWTK